MSTKYPIPVKRGDKWEVDLRAWGFGWHYVIGSAAMPDLEAGAAAMAKLEELRRGRLAEPRGQLELAAGAPVTFAPAIDELLRTRVVYDSEAGRDYVEKTARIVRRDLGSYELAEFQAPHGDARLDAYAASLLLQGLGARTVRNRLGVAFQVLRLAAQRRWLAGVPSMPKLPRVPPPKYDWITEEQFRAIRGQAFSRVGGHPAEMDGEPWPIYVARRRSFLSLMFYLGLHPEDAGSFRGEYISLDLGTYLRVNTKSAAHVPVEQFDELPEPLIDDLRELLRLLGRESFYQAELVGGDLWPHSDRVLAGAQRELKMRGPRLNARILRRSWVRMMRLLGYSLEECAARAGHTDTRMIHEVYSRIPAPLGPIRKSRWKRPAPSARRPPTRSGEARVVQLRPAKEGQGDA